MSRSSFTFHQSSEGWRHLNPCRTDKVIAMQSIFGFLMGLLFICLSYGSSAVHTKGLDYRWRVSLQACWWTFTIKLLFLQHRMPQGTPPPILNWLWYAAWNFYNRLLLHFGWTHNLIRTCHHQDMTETEINISHKFQVSFSID